jgi:demethoxyubiquinone hydroxylase (CLK1/Coq7/Cat5 family)
MRPYQHHRSHHTSFYSHRWFAIEVSRICREFREGQYLGTANNYYKRMKDLKSVIKEHLDDIGMHTSARERNQLLRQIEPLLSNPRSEHGAFVKGAVAGIFDIILAEGVTREDEF